MADTFYITTPIYYVNGLPHIGNSYTTIASDVLARFHRQRGKEVLFLTGTDENATKNVDAAREAGKDIQDFVDELAAIFQRTWKRMDISYDQFIRTTEPRHIKLVQDIFARLRDQGDVYKGTYEGYYCVPDETFWTDTQVVMDENGVAHCPNVECGRPVQRVSEENYFFRLSAYSDRLLRYIEENPGFLQPDFRRNEVLSFIRGGLRDVSITRKGAGWGIPVPGDPDFVIYVWFDALINYLTAVGYMTDEATFQKWWPADVQLMAKDIFVRFHCTFWPGMLMALGLEMPRTLFGHGWWTVDGQKISKRLGNAVDPHDLALELSQESGCRPEIAVDAVRYFVMREIPFGQDGDFSRSSLRARFNGELANDLGNLLNRTLALVDKYFDRVIPEPEGVEQSMADAMARAADGAAEALEAMRPQDALDHIWSVVSFGNKYIDEQAPWRLQKEGNLSRAGTVLYTVLDALRSVAILVRPYMPNAAEAIWTQLGIPAPLEAQAWEDAGRSGRLPSHIPTNPGVPIFPRIDPKKKQEAIARMKEPVEPIPAAPSAPAEAPIVPMSATAEPPATAGLSGPATPAGTTLAPVEAIPAAPVADETQRIAIDDFRKVQLKIAKVLSAERVPKADKLLHLTIDAGEPEPRSLVAGVAQWYAPEDLVGRTIVIVANLQPAKIRGVESNGMLLAAEADGQVVLLGPQGDLPPGATIR